MCRATDPCGGVDGAGGRPRMLVTHIVMVYYAWSRKLVGPDNSSWLGGVINKHKLN